jgi:hypothetical protein
MIVSPLAATAFMIVFVAIAVRRDASTAIRIISRFQIANFRF